MVTTISEIADATGLITALAPGGAAVTIRTPLVEDESHWFLRAVREGVVSFIECPTGCFRTKKWGKAGPDHFDTPAGKPRHLFSKPVGPEAWLNREYVPHIAAYAYLILAEEYDRSASSFSRYRKYSRDLISKRVGSSYETDPEFYNPDGSLHLQVEAKASQAQTSRLAAAIEAHSNLVDLPESAVKEVEYVLDLGPRYLWIVGPGSIDPPLHVYEVSVNGLNAHFHPVSAIPAPPTLAL